MARAAAPFALFLLLLFPFEGALALCVKAPEANLRSGPGTNYRKTWEVFRYMPLKRLLRKGRWYKVSDLDGDVHWIHGDLVTDDYDCAVVKSEKANVRSGPGTRYEKLFFSPVFKYYMFKVLEIRGDWVKVVDGYGDTGWIHKKLLWIQ